MFYKNVAKIQKYLKLGAGSNCGFFWLDKQQSLSLVVILAKIATNRDFTVSGMAVTLQQIFVILYKG